VTETSLADPRAARSREALLGSATTLLRERPSEEITATELVRTAQVSRPTLYQHFGDVSTLFVAAAARRLTAIFEDEAPTPAGVGALIGSASQQSLESTGRESIRHLLGRLRSEASFFLHATRGPGGYLVLGALTELLAARLRTHSPLRQALASPGTPAQLDLFLAHGSVGLVAQWLASDFTGPDSVEATTDRLVELLAFQLGSAATAPAPQTSPTSQKDHA